MIILFWTFHWILFLRLHNKKMWTTKRFGKTNTSSNKTSRGIEPLPLKSFVGFSPARLLLVDSNSCMNPIYRKRQSKKFMKEAPKQSTNSEVSRICQSENLYKLSSIRKQERYLDVKDLVNMFSQIMLSKFRQKMTIFEVSFDI